MSTEFMEITKIQPTNLSFQVNKRNKLVNEIVNTAILQFNEYLNDQPDFEYKIDLSIDLKQADIDIERYKSNNGVCDCPECKKYRGEDEDTGL